jgi:hypothetical protein
MFDTDKEGRISSKDYHLGYKNTSTKIIFSSISSSYSINGVFQVREFYQPSPLLYCDLQR